MTTDEKQQAVTAINNLAEMVHQNARNHGFWDEIEEIEKILVDHGTPALAARFQLMMMSEKIALMHSELSEALEALRVDPSLADKHCPDFSNFEIELSDAVIRILEAWRRTGGRHGEAIMAKHAFNLTRPYKHNKRS